MSNTRIPNPLLLARKRLLSDKYYDENGEIDTFDATLRRMRGAIGPRFGG